MPTHDDIAKHWDENICNAQVSHDYEVLDNYYKQNYPYLSDMLKLSTIEGLDCIEIGVGAGLCACPAIVHGKPKTFDLCDISPKTLEFAKNHLDAHKTPYTTTKYILSNMENMESIKSESYDVVYALGSIHHTFDPAKALMEISRILRKNGRVIFMFYNKDSIRYHITYPIQVRFYNKFNYKSVDDAVRNIDGPTNPCGIAYTKKQVREMCSKAGIQIDNIVCKELRYFFEKKYIVLFHDWFEKKYGFGMYIHGHKV